MSNTIYSIFPDPKFPLPSFLMIAFAKKPLKNTKELAVSDKNFRAAFNLSEIYRRLGNTAERSNTYGKQLSSRKFH
jgi:hypothetical protein